MRLLIIIFLFFTGNILYCQNNNVFSGEKIVRSDKPAENKIKYKKQPRRINNTGYSFNNIKNLVIPSEINDKTLSIEQRKIYLFKIYGYTNGLKIFKGSLWQGMTIEMVLDSKGIPYAVNRNVNRGGTFERWVYSEEYLFFENGILTRIIVINKEIG